MSVRVQRCQSHYFSTTSRMYWPKQVALQLGTMIELSRNYLRTVRVTSENCQVIIIELSGNHQGIVRELSENCQGTIRELS